MEEREPIFCVDIDQTMSTGYVGSSVLESKTYYQDRGIMIPEQATRYMDFFQFPAVLRIHEELPGARVGVQKLTEVGQVGYFTVRKSDDEDEQIAIQAATRSWLHDHQFPGEVTFCQGMAQKLLAIAERYDQVQGKIILIDDSWHKALNAMRLLAKYDEATAQAAEILRERLTIFAFGAHPDELPIGPVVRLEAMPDWSGIEPLLTQGGFLHGISSNP